jgi:hypothetical protein
MAMLKKSTIAKAKGTSTRAPKRSSSGSSGVKIDVPVYLSSEEVPDSDRLHKHLTITSPALTDENELRKLIELTRVLAEERRNAVPYGQSASSVNVIGPGGYPSSRFPRISPDAFDNRAALLKYVSLVELPEKIRWG